MLNRAIVVVCLFVTALSDEIKSPRIVVVGAGPSGVAATARLIENGFDNVLLLEAENRIGGRVCTVPFGNQVVDLGAQWVHGQKGNIAYELALPLGLVDPSEMEHQLADVYTSKGDLYNPEIADSTFNLFKEANNDSYEIPEGVENSLGEFFEGVFNEYFKKHPEISLSEQKALLWLYNLLETSMDSAENWHDVSTNQDGYEDCEGEQSINWKERGYSTILDILMKKLPNPEEELPVMNKTILNSEVSKVDYTSEDGPVKLTTTDGKEYLADHVIMTPSLGVLKAEHETLFDPQLPESKVRNIKGLGYGSACKIFLDFKEPWWGDKAKEKFGFMLLWDENDKKEYESDPQKKWLLGAIGFVFVEHKPNLLEMWISSTGALEVENIKDDQVVMNETMAVLHRFFSRDYNITQPTALIRSNWHTNKHFRGTYSYRSLDTQKMNCSAEQLSEPIVKGEKPVILFGGEATNKRHFSTVNGAIETGQREADRLINLYKANKSSNENSS